MTAEKREWTVLVTVAQSDSQPAITDEQSNRILNALGGYDSWIQYPPASGRGHGFETRWWQLSEDAGSAAVEATERFQTSVDAEGLDVSIVLVHVASAEDRLNETTIGLERRATTSDENVSWNVMIRAIAGSASNRQFSRSSLDSLLALLPGAESSGFSRDGMAEVRFWIDGNDAVAAADAAAAAFSMALVELGYSDWTIVRSHVTSIAEARRTAYLGVERRVLEGDRSTLPIAIQI